MPTSLLRQCLDEIAPYITDIVNASLETGLVPQSFKQAIVKPLLKNSGLDPDNLKNYRPVSNLPFVSKILEKVVLEQLSNHIARNGLQVCFQSAYRQHHSTETALLRIVNDLLQVIDKGKSTILTLLDLSAAFDTLDHDILLGRLRNTFGVSDTALNWFHSYLHERKQVVSIGRSQSKEQNILYGVPQGSVLGPVLFVLYTTP